MKSLPEIASGFGFTHVILNQTKLSSVPNQKHTRNQNSQPKPKLAHDSVIKHIQQVPFIFKNLVDTLSQTSQATTAAAAAEVATSGGLSGPALEAASAVPFAMVLGYGIARTTASGAQEVSAAYLFLHHAVSCLGLPCPVASGLCLAASESSALMGGEG